MIFAQPSIARQWSVLLIACLLAGCAAVGRQGEHGAATLSLEDCQLSAPGISIRMAARCGRLVVPENRQPGDSKPIELFTAVIPAISRSPAPDPLFILAGGPGQAASESYLQLSGAFERIHQKRDIVLVDQRGTGKSAPLECSSQDETGTQPEQEQQIRQCLDQFQGDPRQYTTWVAAADLDQVRQALGYGKINLYGVSYGTRAALTYLKLFPDQVRTVILDGVVPQDTALGLNEARYAQQALDAIFARCASEPACSQAFPRVDQEFQQLMQQLKQAPRDVTLPDPVSGEVTRLEITPERMATTIRLLSYTPETAALIPLLIHHTAASQDYRLMASQYLILVGQLANSISNGVSLSVLCSEDIPFFTPAQAAQANQDTYLGTSLSDDMFKICEIWPHDPAPKGFKDPVHSETPALLLSGAADPVTPAENASRVLEGFPNGISVVAPGQGHNLIFRGCIPRLAAQFIEEGTTRGLDTGCVEEIKAMPFFVNYSGPQP